MNVNVSWLLFTWGPTRMVCLGWAGERAVPVLCSGGGVTVPVVGGRMGFGAELPKGKREGSSCAWQLLRRLVCVIRYSNENNCLHCPGCPDIPDCPECINLSVLLLFSFCDLSVVVIFQFL